MTRRGLLSLLAAALLAGCGPASTPEAARTLPAPQVHIVQAAPAVTHTSEPLLPARTAIPTRAAAVEGSLAEMARSVYGEKLIAQIQIPSIRVDAPVVPVGWQAEDVTGEDLAWESPEASVGWAVSSALPDQDGNIILYGHNNLHSNVFMHLDQLETGDVIQLRTGQGQYDFVVDRVEIIPVTDPKADAAAVRKYFQPGGERRLTILSCWPPASNTHRVIVTASPRG